MFHIFLKQKFEPIKSITEHSSPDSRVRYRPERPRRQRQLQTVHHTASKSSQIRHVIQKSVEIEIFIN